MEPDKRTQESQSKGEFTHDRFVDAVWSNNAFARRFLNFYLPPEIVKELDLSSTDLLDATFVGPNGSKCIGDVFYKIKLRSGGTAPFLVLLEHKSTPDRYVAIQMLKYEAALLEYMTQNLDKFQDRTTKKLPAPYSVLLCQDEHPQLESLLSRIGDVDYGPRTRFHVVNFQKASKDKLGDEPWLFAAMHLSKYMRYAPKSRDDPQLLEVFRALFNARFQYKELFDSQWNLFLNYAVYHVDKSLKKTEGKNYRPFTVLELKERIFAIQKEEISMVKTDEPVYIFFEDIINKRVAELAEERAEKLAEERAEELAEKRAEELAEKRVAEAKAEAEAEKDSSLCQTIRQILLVRFVHFFGDSERLAEAKEALNAVASYSELLELSFDNRTFDSVDDFLAWVRARIA